MKITLYVDVVSPFAYVAYYVLRHDQVFKACEITYIPLFLGGVMKATGNTAPIQIKNKDKWIMTERLLWARYFNVPMTTDMPEGFPPLTLNVMRSIVAAGYLASAGQPSSSRPAQAAIVKALDAFFEAYWVNKRNIIDKDIMADVLRSAGADVDAVVELAGGEAKQILQRNTNEAFADGSFGLPWFICENDRGEKGSFWGVDHLGVVLDFLGLEKPRAGGWKAML
ncbi:Glutathione S-transferase kappa 1 [Cytospora mali]|uniref:Glutathione S-transferase kappa n=1 Tax=Cytospora mali TaxID=578113 RepID=A0A194UNW7_CYTMA|nr:Glutathione S-transferase kappa 1 [Valsa mali var. pyri (nom. inval.)]